MKAGDFLTQSELRDLYWLRLRKETQSSIAKNTGINASVLSQFKFAKIDLYPYLFEKLEAYLTSVQS